MFNRIATRYDLINDLLSLGIHRAWLKKAIEIISNKPPKSILDLATGTGKFAFALRKHFPNADIFGLDISTNMLEIAKKRNETKKKNIIFLEGDALQLPFPENSFDIVTMSYGIRNVKEIERCLEQIYKVLKPSGEFIIVEFGKPFRWFLPFYKLYQKTFVKIIGGLLSGDFNAYSYLVNTINNFPSDLEFVKIVDKTKLFKNAELYPLTFGIAYIYKGVKINSI